MSVRASIPSHVLTAHVRLPLYRYSQPEQRRTFNNELLDRLSKIGGVESASISTGLPMFDSLSVRSFRLEGELKDKPERETDIKDVSEDYFRTAGTPVLRGRVFTRSEAMDVRSGVAIVNETFARMNFPQGDAIGHAIEFGSNEKPDRKLIVGVVPDSHEMGLEEAARPEVFLPTRDIGAMAVMLGKKGDPLALSNALTAAVWAVDKDQTASDIKTLAAHFHLTTEQRRFDTPIFRRSRGIGAAAGCRRAIWRALVYRHAADARDRITGGARGAIARRAAPDREKRARADTRRSGHRRGRGAGAHEIHDGARVRRESFRPADVCGCCRRANGGGAGRLLCAGAARGRSRSRGIAASRVARHAEYLWRQAASSRVTCELILTNLPLPTRRAAASRREFVAAADKFAGQFA